MSPCEKHLHASHHIHARPLRLHTTTMRVRSPWMTMVPPGGGEVTARCLSVCLCVCVCVCVCVCALPCCAPQVGPDRVKAWLQHVRFTPLDRPAISIYLSCQDDDPHTQRTLLDLLPAIRDAIADPSASVDIGLRWPYTRAAFKQLRCLPEWSDVTLNLSKGTYVLPAEEYKELAWHIPASYRKFMVWLRLWQGHSQRLKPRAWHCWRG